jgi:hypothetical protein
MKIMLTDGKAGGMVRLGIPLHGQGLAIVIALPIALVASRDSSSVIRASIPFRNSAQKKRRDFNGASRLHMS